MKRRKRNSKIDISYLNHMIYAFHSRWARWHLFSLYPIFVCARATEEQPNNNAIMAIG